MKNKLNIAEQLKQKYHKCEEVTNFKEMIERSAQIYKTRTAFKLKNKDGEIYSKTYEEVKRSEEHTSELQSRSVSSYAVFCLKKKR